MSIGEADGCRVLYAVPMVARDYFSEVHGCTEAQEDIMFPIKIHRNLRPFWKFGFNKGWYYNEYRDNRFESCGYVIIYAFKRSIHVLWSYKWYQWWLSTKQEFESDGNFIIFPFGFGYPQKKK